MKNSFQKAFLITISITSEGDIGYNKGRNIKSVVFSNNSHNAKEKFMNKHCGSEYCSYEIVSIEQLDNDVFKPLF